MVRNSIIIIGGPTASGKSSLALMVAKKMDGVIINSDALQLYQAIPVISAQPSVADKVTVPHLLYGILPPDIPCSAGKWVEMAIDAIDDTHRQGKIPVIVGGTGLYLLALIQGFPAIPDIDPDIRDQSRQLQQEMGNSAFHQLLEQRDPVMAARLNPSDTQRLVRAYEVVLQTGLSLDHFQKQPPVTHYHNDQMHLFTLFPDRTRLYEQCNGRFISMIENGALEEVRALGDYPLTAPIWKALGMKEIRDYIQGSISLEVAIAMAQQATRHYAKRQITWFRHQFPMAHAIHFEEPMDAENQLVRAISQIHK